MGLFKRHKDDRPLVTDPVNLAPSFELVEEANPPCKGCDGPLCNCTEIETMTGKRCLMLPQSWFQNRQREQGNRYCWLIVDHKDGKVTVVGVTKDGTITSWSYTTSINAVRVA